MSETSIRRDIDINLAEVVLSSIDNMEPNVMMKAMLEFNSKALILSQREGSLLQREIKEGGKAKLEEVHEELKTLQAKHEEDRASWDKKGRSGWLKENG